MQDATTGAYALNCNGLCHFGPGRDTKELSSLLSPHERNGSFFGKAKLAAQAFVESLVGPTRRSNLTQHAQHFSSPQRSSTPRVHHHYENIHLLRYHHIEACLPQIATWQTFPTLSQCILIRYTITQKDQSLLLLRNPKPHRLLLLNELQALPLSILDPTMIPYLAIPPIQPPTSRTDPPITPVTTIPTSFREN